MEISKAKQALRKDMACLMKSYTKTQLQDWSEQIRSRLEELPLFQAARCIALYHALPGEVQTAPWLERWRAMGKRLALPLVAGDDLLLLPYDRPASLVPGAFGIMEPALVAGARSVEDEVDLVIVPGVAFDRQLNRLGRGRGFYDRLLATLRVPKIGICFHIQLFDEIPAEIFDRRMDVIVSEREILP